MIAERHYKNEDGIKEMIVDGHRRGVCDSYGRSMKKASGEIIAKPRPRSSVAKVYVYKEGKMVLKYG